MAATAVQALAAVRRDPVGFHRDVLRFECWSKQREVAESVRDHKRTAVRSAHGVGKTSIAARTILWFLAAFPYSKVISTAPTLSQVREQLWREIAVAYRHAEGFFDGTLTDTRLELGPDWFALGLSTDRPERFAGHHAEHLLLVVDEASGVDEQIFEAAEGFLTSEGARVLLIGNPTAMSGTFHRAFHAERALWNTIEVSALDTPVFTGEQVPDEVLRRLPSREWVETATTRWGEGSPLYQVRVLGQFPTSADDTVIPLVDVEAAQRQGVAAGLPVVVACDPARFGSDETVIVVRRGHHVRVAATLRKRDLMETAGRILRVARETETDGGGQPTIVVDEIGVGGGLVDRLRETREFPVSAYNASGKARDSKEYPNARSQAWFDFAQQLPGLDLDDDEQLAAELVAPTYRIDSAGRRVVEAKADTKRRLGRSPDRADAVLMAYAVPPQSHGSSHVPQGRIGHRARRGRHPAGSTVGRDLVAERLGALGVPVEPLDSASLAARLGVRG